MRALGEIIRELRERKGWSKRRLALYAEVSDPTIHNIEVKNSNPTASTLAAIARELGTSVDYMLIEAGMLPAQANTEIHSPEIQHLQRLIDSLPPEERKQAQAIVINIAEALEHIVALGAAEDEDHARNGETLSTGPPNP